MGSWNLDRGSDGRDHLWRFPFGEKIKVKGISLYSCRRFATRALVAGNDIRTVVAL
jgi:hypothetical protein